VGRIRWFIAGAVAGAGALVATPDAYRRLRAALESVAPPPSLPPGAPDTPATEIVEMPATAVHEDPIVPEPTSIESEDTVELRIRIDETRARIHEKAHGPGQSSGPQADS
jgi:hypothetical protein